MTLTTLSPHEFGAMVEQHRRELQAHCYRMLGTIQDAEDMVQETFLRAWKRRETYIRETSLRAWLYKIATNVCLDALKRTKRRRVPKTMGSAGSPADPIPASITEPIWIEPYPDELLTADDDNPEKRLRIHEEIGIAFVALLHLLPPRQRAVLLLTDVLEWQTSEVAHLLNTTPSAVKSALWRARETLAAKQSLFNADDAAPLVSPDAELHTVLRTYVRAWETADVDALIDLLRHDATFSMPPIPSWYQGRESIRQLVTSTIFAGIAHGRWCLLPTRANRQPAFGLYRRSEQGGYEAYGIQVITFAGSSIADIITFRTPTLIDHFGLPPRIA